MKQLQVDAWREGFGHLLGQLSELQSCLNLDTLHVVTKQEGISSGVGLPLIAGLIKAGEESFLYRHFQSLALSGLQFTGLGKCFQFLGRLLIRSLGGHNINLSHLFAGSLAHILHRYGHFHTVANSLDGRFAKLKVGITQAETEGISHLTLESIEVTIAHIDVFFMIREVHTGHITAIELLGEVVIFGILGEILGRWHVSGAYWPCHCQATGRIGLTYEHIGNAVSTLLTRLPSHENGVNTVAPRGCFHDTSRIYHNDNGLTGGMESVADPADHGFLGVG